VASSRDSAPTTFPTSCPETAGAAARSEHVPGSGRRPAAWSQGHPRATATIYALVAPGNDPKARAFTGSGREKKTHLNHIHKRRTRITYTKDALESHTRQRIATRHASQAGCDAWCSPLTRPWQSWWPDRTLPRPPLLTPDASPARGDPDTTSRVRLPRNSSSRIQSQSGRSERRRAGCKWATAATRWLAGRWWVR